MRKRPTFAEIALRTAQIWSERSEDLHQKVGACILNKDGRVLSVGYNGLLSKINANEKFWSNRDLRRNYIIHAETNALSFINKNDLPFLIAVTLLPCADCAKNIACHGIKKVVYNREYERDQTSKKIFKLYDIELLKI